MDLALNSLRTVDVPALVIRHPNWVFISLTSFLSYLALGPSPQFLPLILLLSALQLHTRLVLRRPLAIARLGTLWIFMSIFISAAHLPTVQAAVPPSLYFLITSLSVAGLASATAIISVVVDTHFSRRVQHSWSQLTFFPPLWATVWWFFSIMSPIGRLIAWSPVQGTYTYQWLLPYLGPIGIDFVVGAWAVIICQATETLVVGSPHVDLHLPGGREHAVSSYRPEDDIEDAEDHHHRRPDRMRGNMLLAVILGLAALPSLQPPLPSPVNSSSTTILSVACALPYVPGGHPSLQNYKDETKKLVPHAKVILWPEGAIRLDSPEQRADFIKDIRRISQGSLVAVGFEEYALPDSHSTGRAGLKRNGLLVIDSEHGVVYEYYKRNLVPFVESFPMIASLDPPAIFDFNTDKPYHQSLPFTASICLDFASLSPFSELRERPALILAPANTWERAIGVSMWDQARSRAAELGSTVLWCDGGEGGVSGVAGPGMSEVVQVGQGSWVRKIGIERPFGRRERTLYAKGGDLFSLFLAWAIFGGGWMVAALSRLQLFQNADEYYASHIRANIFQWRSARDSSEEQSTVDAGERAPLLG